MVGVGPGLGEHQNLAFAGLDLSRIDAARIFRHRVHQPVAVGDYILNHVGYAIRRIPDADIQGTLDLYEELLRDTAQEDLMSADVRGELAAAPEKSRAR